MASPDFISKTKLETFASLNTPKMRHKRMLFPVEGLKSVIDILPVFELDTLLMESSAWENKNAGELLTELLTNTDPEKIRLIKPGDMKRLSTFATPAPVIAVFRMPETVELRPETLSENLGKGLYLLLDGVRDPGNFGTIVRTADWFGLHTIFASKECVDVFNQKVIQATMGSLAHVKVIYADLEELIKKNPGIPVFGTLLSGENIYATRLPEAGFIVMGNEGQGITEPLRKLITHPLTIPPYGSIHGESLNVAAATAIVLSEFRRDSTGQ